MGADMSTEPYGRRAILKGTALAGGLGGLGLVAAADPAHAAELTVGPDWTNVRSHGAIGNGTTDDAGAIQAALDATPPGGVTYLPVGVYAIGRPLVVPPAVTLLGSHANRLSGPGYVTPKAYLVAMPTFAGDAMLRMVDREEGGYPQESGGQRISNVCLEGTSAAVVAGIRATGRVHDVVIDMVSIQNVSGDGIVTAHYTRADGQKLKPYTWSVHNTTVNTAGGDGFHFEGATDTILVNCQSLGARRNGFYFTAMANSTVTSCRAEWSTGHGFYLTGNWYNAQGSGGMLMTGCSTDRNGQHGVFLDCNGGASMVLNGLMLRRDGRNGYPGTGGGGYAGVAAVGARTPIVISGITCYPGVGDDGAGVNSPQYGLSFTGNTFVSVSGGYIHAATRAVYDGGGNGTFLQSAIGTATGPTNAPIRV